VTCSGRCERQHLERNPAFLDRTPDLALVLVQIGAGTGLDLEEDHALNLPTMQPVEDDVVDRGAEETGVARREALAERRNHRRDLLGSIPKQSASTLPHRLLSRVLDVLLVLDTEVGQLPLMVGPIVRVALPQVRVALPCPNQHADQYDGDGDGDQERRIELHSLKLRAAADVNGLPGTRDRPKVPERPSSRVRQGPRRLPRPRLCLDGRCRCTPHGLFGAGASNDAALRHEG
jgi:hypothetical protein